MGRGKLVESHAANLIRTYMHLDAGVSAHLVATPLSLLQLEERPRPSLLSNTFLTWRYHTSY
jgi:hypothetical protein